jgi:serine/threonine-protein kinase RsbW
MTKSGKLRLPALLENVPRAIDCVTESAKEAGFADRELHQIQVAVDEACANVVEHAYKGQSPGIMEISCHQQENSLVIQVRDWGNSFDPDAVAEPDTEAPLEERPLGGLGLFLIRQFVDEAHFAFDPELGNVLTMVKRRPEPPTPTVTDG